MTRLKIENHWIETALRVPSENFDKRPANTHISLLVIHCISLPPGIFGGEEIDNLFLNRLDPTKHPYFQSIHTLKVSTHVLIHRSGKIKQYVPFDLRAWHAGKSIYNGRPNCNDFSIGIELEGTDDTKFTDLQYDQLALVVNSLMDHYPSLSKKRITGHSDIAPGRKTDPGKLFDWNRFYRSIETTWKQSS